MSPSRVERWFSVWSCGAPAVVLLPGVDQFFSEPAGQRLTNAVEQFGKLNVVISIVLPEEALGLKKTEEVRLKSQQKKSDQNKKVFLKA